LLIVGFVLTILLLLQPPPSSACGTGGDLGAGPSPGNLGGLGGTGITGAELATVRSSPLAAGNRFTEGIFQATSYGPPWGGIQGAGIATAAGLRINGGAPHKYFVATDPAIISSGQWLYVWPNQFNWRGPFLAADTGGAIDGRHIDIYDWRGRNFQLQWNRPVDVTRGPSSPLGPGPSDMSPTGGSPPLANTTTTPTATSTTTTPTTTAGAPLDCASAAPGSLGELTGTPEAIINGVVEYAHANGFPNVTVETVRVANAAHSVQTTSGNTSDHKGPPDFAWAADISNGTSPTTEMDALAATIAGAFSIPWQGSGLVSAGNDEYRLQLIYRTCGGGDHWNHIHFGVKKVPGVRPAQTSPSTARPC
jgi:3D (Asp-Asp-Asp) domain-containing protein